MQYQIAILSSDTVFARMLELEFRALFPQVLAVQTLGKEDRAQVLLLDLDSASAPEPNPCVYTVGFSRLPAMLSESARLCTLILRRPFSVKRLREEVLSLINGTAVAAGERSYPLREERSVHLRDAERELLCDGEKVPLSPTEFAVLRCLLEHRGSPVSRETLAAVAGGDPRGSNKVDVYVCLLRRKTDSLPHGRLIFTARGEGYRIP